MGLIRTVAPATEPLTLAEAKLHCRVDVNDDDALITALIVAARGLIENETGRALITQTWVQTLDAFPAAEIILPQPNLLTVTSITYVDADGATQTLAAPNYVVYTSAPRGQVLPAYGLDWPGTRDQKDAVSITFTAGFGDADDVPQEIKQWMLLHVAAAYENRSASSDKPMTMLPYIDRLLDAYRVMVFS